MRTLTLKWSVAAVALGMGFIALPNRAIAQVVSDGILPTSVTSSNNLDFTINGGSRSGDNLFHGFDQFSVPTGGAAIFNNAIEVQNIFSRVTGESVSNIDGVIQANGGANLFLLNPNGIVFGPNASLTIGGSFLGTTANSIQFSDGAAFSARPSSTTPLLTMSAPVGLQMGTDSGVIAVRGNGHRLAQSSFFFPILAPAPPTGLSVSAGNTLALIGNTIDLEGGVVLAPSGHIELGSLDSSSGSSSVDIDTASPRWHFDYANDQSNEQPFANIRLSGQALVDASGFPAGSLHFQGRTISVLEGSVVRLQNLGGAALGDLVIDASGLLEMRGVGTAGFQNNLVSTENLGTGAGSHLRVSAHQLQMQDGSSILTKTFSAEAGGDVTIEVLDTLDLAGWSEIAPTIVTAIGANTLADGAGGQLMLSSRQLQINKGANILNLTVGAGLGGNMTVDVAEDVVIAGENLITSGSSYLGNVTLNQANSGNLTLTASQVSVREGASVGTSTLSSGDGGDLTIRASESIDVSGAGLNSGLSSQVGARAILLPEILSQAYGLPPIPTGNSGTVVLDTDRLQVSDRAVVGVDNQGRGNAGSLLINANQARLNRQGRITAGTASGEGGNLVLTLKELLSLRHNSAVTTTADGTGNGGNITINAPVVLGLENSDIVANAAQGQGGNIQITTQGIFGLKYRDQLTPENDITASSEFGVNGTVDIATPGVDPSEGLVALPVNLADSSQQIAQGCTANQDSSFVATGRGGLPINPTQQIGAGHLWSDTRDLSAYLQQPTDQAAPEATTAASLIQATGWQHNADGNVELLASTGDPTATSPFATCSAAR